MTESIKTYITQIQQNLQATNATEHTHRPALQAQYGKAGTDGLERPDIFNTPVVRKLGKVKLLRESKEPNA